MTYVTQEWTTEMPNYIGQQDTSSERTLLHLQDDRVNFSLLNDFTAVLPPLLDSNPEMAIPYLIVVVLAIVAGTSGNLIILGTLLRDKVLRAGGNRFLINMAFSDLCVTMIADPMCILGKFPSRVFAKYLYELIAL